MKNKTKLILFALTLFFVLGLGAMQAMSSSSTAAPAAQPGDVSEEVLECIDNTQVESAQSCSMWVCQDECPEFGGDYIAGRCLCCG